MTADMVASIKGYVGPLSFNKTTGKAGPIGCNGVVCDPGADAGHNQSCARAGACVEDWNQTLANGQVMWGAIPPRKSDDSDSTFRAPPAPFDTQQTAAVVLPGTSIPTLLYLPSRAAGTMGTLLAGGGMIGSHKELVLRRSFDGGRSWGELTYPCGNH